MNRPALILVVSAGLACSASSTPDQPSSSSSATSGGHGGVGGTMSVGGSSNGGFGGLDPSGSGGSTPQCATPPNPAGSAVTIAPPYDMYYDVYDLGPVPGVPDRLGGCVVKHDDPNVLLIAGNSEAPGGQIYSIGVTRGPCGHILGWNGVATAVAATPYVDANLVYTQSNLLFYSQWPTYKISQMLPGSSAPDLDVDLVALGIVTAGDSGPGGIGFVPSGTAAGELRIVTWPGGRWYHVDLMSQGNLYDVTAITETTILPNNPGGFAYVPAGSPGFPSERLIVAEWVQSTPTLDRVATYAVDAQGDPIVATRDEFLSKFDRPWGAYFEPVTGDFLFLQWGITTANDRVYIVQGFSPPPPPPDPPN